MADEEKVEVAVEAPATEEKTSVEVPEKFAKLVAEIEEMKVIDLAELVSILEDKFGVSAAAPMMMAAGGAAAGADAPEEKSAFDVELSAIGESKINVIKAVREITGLGLKEAKDMVDGTPTVIKAGVAKAEAEAMKKQIEDAGGAVTLK